MSASPGSRPRIAYITTAFPWRSETAVIKEVHELRQLGFEIEIVSLKRTSFDGTFDPKALQFREHTLYPGPAFWTRSLARALYTFATSKRYRDLLKLTLRQSGKQHLAKTLYLAALAPELASYVRRHGIAYVHANFASYQAFAAMAIHRLTDIPYGFTVHAHDIFFHDFMIEEKVSSAALVISISRFNSEFLARNFRVSPEKIRVIHCGVDLDEFTPTVPPEAETPLVLSVGRLTNMKGFDVLIEACRLLRRRVALRCVVVGNGPDRDLLRDQIRQSGVDDLIDLRLSLAQEELVKLYRDCNLYVQPCRRAPSGEMDGIPATLMEAMAVGRPVVPTRLSGIPELITHEREGLLAPPEDAEALADAMERILAAPEWARELGRAARSKVVEEFDIQANTRVLGREIRSVLRPGEEAAPS